MHSKPTIAAIVGAFFILVVGNLLSGDAKAADDACSFLTQDRVSAVLGVSVGAGKLMNLTDPLVCEWSVPGDPSLTAKKVVLKVITPEKFTIGKARIAGIIKTPVRGIGDDAYYVTASSLGTILNVRKGSTAFSISVKGRGFSVKRIKAMEKTLAQDALSKH